MVQLNAGEIRFLFINQLGEWSSVKVAPNEIYR